MTLLVLALIGMGVIFIASALDDTPIVQTFQKILGGQAIDWTGSQGAVTLNPNGTVTANNAPIQGVAGTGAPGTQNATPAPKGGWWWQQGNNNAPGPINYQVPPNPVATNTQGTGGSSSTVGTGFTQYPVTQAHGVNGETGIDLGTPFHTPIGALAGGKVVSASYGPWGGSVFVAVQNGAGWLYYNYLHLDQIMVQTGQQLAQGQLIGLSGGQLSGGFHPAQYPYSTGAHTEFGVYTTPYISPTSALDPTSFYQFG